MKPLDPPTRLRPEMGAQKVRSDGADALMRASAFAIYIGTMLGAGWSIWTWVR